MQVLCRQTNKNEGTNHLTDIIRGITNFQVQIQAEKIRQVVKNSVLETITECMVRSFCEEQDR